MLKKFGLLAVAGIAALALGTAVFGGGQSASAETTAIVQVNCLLIVGAVDDVADDAAVAGDYTAACATQLPPGDPAVATAQPYTILALARQLGDEDGTLEASDFSEFEGYDAQQLSTDCTTGFIGTTGCTSLIFAFVDDEKPVTLDNDSEVTSLQSPATTDFICNTPSGADLTLTGLGQDNDCDDVITDDGDGVVLFHVVNASASRGEEKNVNVLQEAVQQSITLTIVGIPDDIEIVLAEDIISTNGSVSASDTCASNIDVTESIEPAESTTAVVTLEDQDNVLLAMFPIDIAVDPPADDPTIAQLGNNNNTVEGISGNTSVTLDTGNDSLPIGYYTTVCGGSGTGVTDIAVESLTDGSTASAELTVVGFANATALVAAPAEIKCDGSETSTVSATITDSDGNNVANGTEVTFSVVALGTANPINTTTTDGVATSVITPLSNSSAGVTVIVSVDNGSDASTVSIRVDCALPLVTQPTPAVPTTVPTGPISPPDTGNGGYLAQDGGSSLWTMIALAIGGTIVVAGGLVARRSSN